MTRFQPFNDLPAARLEELKRDIEARGVVNPILVDEHDKTIDGHQRRRVAAELRIDCPRIVIEGLSDDEKMSLAISLNTFRRHLSGTERMKALGQMARLGMSVRRISAATGIPKSTVQDAVSGVRDRTPEPPPGVDPETGEITREPEGDDPPPPPAKRKGADGKEYPASKPKAEPKPPPEPTALDRRIAFHAVIDTVQKAMRGHDWDVLVAAFASGDEIDRSDLPSFAAQLRGWAEDIEGALAPALRRVK